VADRARDLDRRLLIVGVAAGDRRVVPQDGDVTAGASGIWLRAAVLVLVLVAGLGAALTLDLPAVAAVRSWVGAGGGAGWAVLVLAVALVLLAPVPRSAVSVLVGVVAGFGSGLGIAFAGGLLAAVVAFALSRWLGRAAAVRLAGPRLSRADDLVAGRGFVAVLTGRLVPVVPFVVVNYGAGLTGVRLAPYVAGTALGMVPSTVVQVGIGASAGWVADRAAATLVVSLLVVVLAAAVGLLLWRRRRCAVPA
jgi:uncharacterized membrane protein YdjX (TVP38/TMEM64 family)